MGDVLLIGLAVVIPPVVLWFDLRYFLPWALRGGRGCEREEAWRKEALGGGGSDRKVDSRAPGRAAPPAERQVPDG